MTDIAQGQIAVPGALPGELQRQEIHICVLLFPQAWLHCSASFFIYDYTGSLALLLCAPHAITTRQKRTGLCPCPQEPREAYPFNRLIIGKPGAVQTQHKQHHSSVP